MSIRLSDIRHFAFTYAALRGDRAGQRARLARWRRRPRLRELL